MGGPKVFSLGDVQFQALNAWNYELGNRFLDWFEGLEVPEDSYFVQLGDMTEKDSNPGDVVRQLERFFAICTKKFKKSFVLVGNHDLKKYHGKLQISFAFAEEKGKIDVVKDFSVLDAGGISILAMPHVMKPGLTVTEYYNSLGEAGYAAMLPKGLDEFDLCVGHWQKQGKEDDPQWLRYGVDISAIPAKAFSIGHIHDRPFPEYQGSAWPLKISEEQTAFPRAIGVFGKGGLEREIAIPKFCEYCRVEYPSKIVDPDDGVVRIYTVDGCPNMTAAQELYRGSHIRSIGTPPKKDSSATGTESGFKFADYVDAFNQYMAEKKPKIGRNAVKIVVNSLKKAQ